MTRTGTSASFDLSAGCRSLYQAQLQQEHPELFAQVPARVWQRHWNVDSRAAGSGENALRYLSRYVFKTATSNRLVHLEPDGKVRWSYRESKTGRPTSLQLEALEFMGRFLQHILPRGFARVRTFGWLHPAAKVRANRVRALLGQAPRLTPEEEQAWNPPADPEREPPPPETQAVCSAPLCLRCQQVMQWIGSWRPGQPRPFPKRPP